MGIEQTYVFDTPSDFTFSNTEISGSAGKLKLVDNTGQTFNQDFNSDTGFTYDSALAEFTGGVAQQLDRTPTNSILATLFDSLNLNWHKSGGSLTGTAFGSPTITGGKLVCSGSQGVEYSANTNPVETHKLLLTPDYTAAPSANADIIDIRNGVDLSNRVNLQHSSGGTFTLFLNDSTGSIVDYTSLGVWNPTAGQEYEIELVVDSSAGTARVFVDGTLIATTSPGPWSRTSIAVSINIGASPDGAINAEGSFDDYIYFSGAQHTANYTPGYTVPPTIYGGSEVELPDFSYASVGAVQELTNLATTEVGSVRYTIEGQYFNGSSWVASDGTFAQANTVSTINTNLSSLDVEGEAAISVSAVFTNTNTQSSADDLTLTYTGQKYPANGHIEPVTGIDVQSMSSYSQTASEPAGTEAKVILKIDGVLTYHDGSSWVTSDGSPAQANTATEVNNNLSSLELGSNSTVFIRWLLVTPSDTDTPSIQDATIDYTFGATAALPTTCSVFGYVRDVAGDPVEGVTVTFVLDEDRGVYSEANSNIVARRVYATTDDNGYFVKDLIRSSEFESGGTYKVVLSKSGALVQVDKSRSASKLTFTVPDSATKSLPDLLI